MPKAAAQQGAPYGHGKQRRAGELDLYSALLGTDFFTIILLKQQKLNRRRRRWG
jgi:hypothetical protein